MKKIVNKIKSLMTRTCIKTQAVAAEAHAKLQDNKGEFVVEHGVVFVIILVLAALAIALLRSLMNDTLSPTITQKIKDFFN